MSPVTERVADLPPGGDDVAAKIGAQQPNRATSKWMPAAALSWSS